MFDTNAVSCRKIISVFALVLTFSVSFVYVIFKNSFESYTVGATSTDKTLHLHWKWNDNIACHYENPDDDLPSIDAASFNPVNSLFFHETSCKGGLNSRQSCSVESAARVHPDRQVFVLFSGPIRSDVVSGLSKLLDLPNVHAARIHSQQYVKDTPVAALLSSNGEIKNSNWHIEHVSDILRYVTLFKYGGIYLDTDSVVLKALSPLGKNWAGSERKPVVSTGVVALANDETGHAIAYEVLKEIKSSYSPTIWSHNGPFAMTRTLEKFCSTKNITTITADNCKGFQVYGPEYIYPIYYLNWKEYFEPPKRPWNTSYVHHLWNKFSHSEKVPADSLYAEIARKHCPTIYQTYGENFGD